MSWLWRSPQATRTALSDRVRARFPVDERQLRMREIAYRRLLARLFTTQPERWVIKGGAALLLRLDPNRTSNDIDLAYVDDAGEHAVALAALVEAAAHDAGDFFEFEIDRERAAAVDADHPLERAISVPVTARLGGRLFAEFSVDLVLPRGDVVAVDWLEPDARLTGEPAVDEIGPVAVLTLPSQLADKVCAMFERHGKTGHHSTRARDLADTAMIATQQDIDGAVLAKELAREEQRRRAAGTLVDPLPARFQLDEAQREDWRSRWARATRMRR
jgi:Nucleotidyl transferase AbiEii toxin, Type IV TA system